MSAPRPGAGSPRKVLLDCDPGIDDALAIAFACGHPDLDLCAVTTVAGNVGLTRVTAGPLTNIALAVRRQPELVSQVTDFVIMGGSATRGNTTPAAEFNIATDPEAAAIVFGAGWQVTMVGLDATLQARADEAVRERLAGLGRLGSDLLLP